MAPEQAHGEDVSRLSDLFAASIVLWELLTGERLFAGKTEAKTVHTLLVARFRRPSALAPDLDPRLDAILERGLSRSPPRRYPTARDMALALEACVPAVRPSEIGAWVRRLAGEALAKRERALRDPADGRGRGRRDGRARRGYALDSCRGVRRRDDAVWASAGCGPRGRVGAVAASRDLDRGRDGPGGQRRDARALHLVARTSGARSVRGPRAAGRRRASSRHASSGTGTSVRRAFYAAAGRSRPGAPDARRPTLRARAPGEGAHGDRLRSPYPIDSAGREIFKPECV